MSTALTLTDIELLAITKAVAAKTLKTARDGIEPGEYNLSFDAHFDGTVTVGADYEQKIVNKAKPWAIIAVLLEEANKARSAAGQTGLDLSKLIAMADALDPSLEKAAKEEAETQAAGLKAATLTPCKGKVTAKVTASPLEND